jgi:hypothetical protein
MKNIEMREKIVPYTHVPGTPCLVPCSDWVITPFPALLRIRGASDISVGITGPVTQFLVQMDLERDCVWISGQAVEGCYRLQIQATFEGLFLTVRRAPKEGLLIGGQRLVATEKILLASGGKVSLRRVCERLSLGNWKAQDWDLVRRRNDVREIVPPLFLLGQKTPATASLPEGTVGLLDGKMDVFFRAAFSGVFVPHLHDPLHQGLYPVGDGSGDAMAILGLAYQKIRTQLIEEKENAIRILPGIAEYPVGRARLLSSVGCIHLEWSQGIIRRMNIEPVVNCVVAFAFQKEVASYRICGQRVQKGTTVALAAGTPVLLDRFQK